MTGVKLGDRLLQIGCTDASLLARSSSKVGLSGRACAIVSSDSGRRSARGAAPKAAACCSNSRPATTRLVSVRRRLLRPDRRRQSGRAALQHEARTARRLPAAGAPHARAPRPHRHHRARAAGRAGRRSFAASRPVDPHYQVVGRRGGGAPSRRVQSRAAAGRARRTVLLRRRTLLHKPFSSSDSPSNIPINARRTDPARVLPSSRSGISLNG